MKLQILSFLVLAVQVLFILASPKNPRAVKVATAKRWKPHKAIAVAIGVIAVLVGSGNLPLTPRTYRKRSKRSKKVTNDVSLILAFKPLWTRWIR
jgi:lysylphosphatidylglycerol synthetase-like protein (DUF2156 family)